MPRGHRLKTAQRAQARGTEEEIIEWKGNLGMLEAKET